MMDIQDNFSTYIWEDFDYILYTYYLILYHGFKVYVVPNWPNNMSPFAETRRFPKEFNFEVMDEINFYTCCRQGYSEIQLVRPDNDIFLVVHMDR